MPRFPLLTSRLIRWSFRSNGLAHLATCYDGEPDYHVVLGKTLCGKQTTPSGGWSNAKRCERCWSQGAPAERLKF